MDAPNKFKEMECPKKTQGREMLKKNPKRKGDVLNKVKKGRFPNNNLGNGKT